MPRVDRYLKPKTRTIRKLIKMGWRAADCERQFSIRGRRVRSYDLFGADVFAFTGEAVTLVQATSLSEKRRHFEKIEDDPELAQAIMDWITPVRSWEMWCWRQTKTLGWVANRYVASIDSDGKLCFTESSQIFWP